MEHTIKGEWIPADSTENHLEVAPTTEAGLMAIRDTFEPSRVVFATDRQLANLAKAWERGVFKLG